MPYCFQHLCQMALLQADATHIRKCKSSTTQVHGAFPCALHFDLTGLCMRNVGKKTKIETQIRDG